MLIENQRNLDQKSQQKEKERLEDIRQQKQTMEMMAKQEQDRINEVKAREERAQAFMNRMADGVLADLDAIQKKEDDMIAKYEREKEMRARRTEDEKERKKKFDQ